MTYLLCILIIFVILLLCKITIIYIKKALYKKSVQKYWHKEKDKIIFIYSHKKGWNNFVNNNILPLLNSNTIIYNLSVDKTTPINKIYTIVNHSGLDLNTTKLPFIIKLAFPKPIIYSFNKDFKLIKENNSKLNKDVQEKIQEKLNCFIVNSN